MKKLIDMTDDELQKACGTKLTIKVQEAIYTLCNKLVNIDDIKSVCIYPLSFMNQHGYKIHAGAFGNFDILKCSDEEGEFYCLFWDEGCEVEEKNACEILSFMEAVK